MECQIYRESEMTGWKFYGREKEVGQIRTLMNTGRWFFCSITGRRRIGKTSLIKQAIQTTQNPGRAIVYMQIPDSDERGVVQTFNEAIESQLNDHSPYLAKDFLSLATSIKLLSESDTVIILDEFQYFHRAQLNLFTSYLQRIVDELRDTRLGGIFVLGSIHTEMTALLEDKLSPLFNRVTHTVPLMHFDFQTMFEMFDSHAIADPHQMLFLWNIFEGVPKFYRDCFEQGLLSPSEDHRIRTIEQLFYEGSSPLKDEAENWFLKELRGKYDSILKIIADIGPCGHGELKSKYEELGSTSNNQFGGYLATLTERYKIVDIEKPIFANEKSRKARYRIVDNFLNAWLFSLSRNAQLSKVQPARKAAEKASEHLRVLEGLTFEKMIRQMIEEVSKKDKGTFYITDLIRGYWNGSGQDKIEIDVIAINEDDRKVLFGSCKRSESKFDNSEFNRFDAHILGFLKTKEGKSLSGWSHEKWCFSPLFSDQSIIARIEARGYKYADIDSFKKLLK